METLKKILVPIGIGMGIFALVGVLGSALFVYQEASQIDPVWGWIVLVLIGVGAFLLVVLPALRILALPGALVPPSERSGRRWSRYLQRYADRILANGTALAAYPRTEGLRQARKNARGKEPSADAVAALLQELNEATRHLDAVANRRIIEHAAAVFVVTGASQSGRLDTAIVFATQIRMIKEVAEIYYQRPNARELWRLYANVGGSAFLAGEIQDSELLAVLGAPVSAALSGFVPVSGTTPLVSLMVQSLLDGSANSLLTLRVGILARRYCGVVVGSRQEVVRSASVEAAALLGGVVAQGARRIASATRRLVVQGAVQGPQTAVRGVTGIGANVAQEITRFAGRVGDKAMRASQSALRGLTGADIDREQALAAESSGAALDSTPAHDSRAGRDALSESRTARSSDRDLPNDPSVARESVRFWERVAEFFGA